MAKKVSLISINDPDSLQRNREGKDKKRGASDLIIHGNIVPGNRLAFDSPTLSHSTISRPVYGLKM